MFEDFVDSTSTVPLSKVPLQFLINVQSSEGESCSAKLRFSNSTITKEQLCIPIEPLGYFITTIEVIETETVRLKEINLVAPPGMTRTLIHQTGSNKGIRVQWTPTAQQYGQHVFCLRPLIQTGSVQNNDV
jgi:hypothetical protein